MNRVFENFGSYNKDRYLRFTYVTSKSYVAILNEIALENFARRIKKCR